jgi:hypothetical protein
VPVILPAPSRNVPIIGIGMALSGAINYEEIGAAVVMSRYDVTFGLSFDRMLTRNRLAILCLAMTCALPDGTISRADVVVYKKSCGEYAHESWNLTCKIDKNTFKDYLFQDIQSITICASFNNHGGLNVPATIIYNHAGGEQSMPAELFDTVKFQGIISDRFSWIGTSPRDWGQPGWKMRGELLYYSRPQGSSGSYTETLSNGQRPVGEIRATCSNLNVN